MTNQDLHDAITADSEAAALAAVGNDVGCAHRMNEILPPVVQQFTYVYDRGVLAAFPDPAVGDAFLAGLSLAAQTNPVLARVVKWLSPSEGGIDVGNHVVRAQLDYLSTLGIPGITTDVVNVLKGLAEVPQTITADEVSAAWAPHRPDGRIE